MTQNLPDPADLPSEEDDPRPERQRRSFAGTHQQIRAAAMFYKVAAWITGCMLLLLVVEMILRYGLKVFLYAGGTNPDGTSNALSLAAEGHVAGGFNVSIAVLIAHGWLYVVYLLAVFLLWSLMRWGLGQFIAIALGGVVPFLSFFMEAKVHKQVVREVGANPQAIRRY
jgi:integral membrane protein